MTDQEQKHLKKQVGNGKLLARLGGGVALALGLSAATAGFVIVPHALEGRNMCGLAMAEREQAQSLRNRLEVVLNGESSHAGAFKKLLNSGAVFKTKTRDLTEMKNDLGEIFASADFEIQNLELAPGQVLAKFSENAAVEWQGELEASKTFTPDESTVFSTVTWALTLTPRSAKTTDLKESWRTAAAASKATANVAFVDTHQMLQANGTLLVTLETGMIPGMKLPRRVFAPPSAASQKWKNWLKQESPLPSFLSSVACVAKQDALYEAAQEKIRQVSQPALERLEVLDRMTWLAAAEQKASVFIDKAGQR